MKGKSKRLIVMAGGTGGHIFSGLAVAHYLMAQNWQVRWLGTAERMEADLVPRNGIEIDFIRVFGLRGKEWKNQLSALLCSVKAVHQALQIIRRFRPNAVLGMGGYVSGPGALAAWIYGIPVIVHEQNSIAGLTNRWLARIATTVLQAFPGAFLNAEVVGNPLRLDILNLPIPTERLKGREGPLRVLVIGGSQGAQVFNHTLPEIAERLGNRITLWHQVGKGSLGKVLHYYSRSIQTQHQVTEFIDNMVIAYLWADVVVCRSGALTVSEISAIGLPAIFVPLQHHDRQQYWNARILEDAGAAKIIEQPQFNSDVMCELLMNLHRPILLEMAKKARAMAMPNATARVAEEVIRSVI